MALQSSGQIALSEIATEFGGSAPHALSEYYAGGSNVASGTGSIPSSGEIQLAADFYGTSAEVVLHSSTITPGSRTVKSTVIEEGYESGSGGLSSSAYGSISTTAITGTSAIVKACVDRDSNDAILGGLFHFSLSSAFTGWTSIRINNSVTLNRSAANFSSSGSTQIYQWNTPSGTAGNNTYPTPTSLKIIQ